MMCKIAKISIDKYGARSDDKCVQDPLGLIFFYFALQCHLLASCGVEMLEVSAVAVYNFKAQASLHHVF
jgi:hypothetical protein